MRKFIGWVTKYNKSIAGFIISGFVYWLKVKHDGVNADELIEIIGAALTGGGFVWLIPNNQPKAAIYERDKV